VPLGIEIRRWVTINETAAKYKDAGYYYYDFTYQVVDHEYSLKLMVNDLPAYKDEALKKISGILEEGLFEDIISMPEFKQHGYSPVTLIILLPDGRHPFGWIPSGGEEDEIKEQKLKAMFVRIDVKLDKPFEITHTYYQPEFFK
jgi:hypothetical protein